METETGFRCGKWKRKPVPVSTSPEKKSVCDYLWFPRGKWKQKLVSVTENGNGYQFPFRSLPPSKSLSVVNSEKNYPAKKMRVDLPVEDRRG